ncbi:ran-specific GTPase-activating protein-like isoform X2 [Penaeus japonicus]|uniref:ran-specific GTPase-activating protein-like isoform X2 n=1 Tax=Penaeus japonicus TaxID=27405 RepID=UPI001C70FB5A|nr:ran-specific GTPase-activating protein-like isoform X2 [Penaeus japonicus]
MLMTDPEGDGVANTSNVSEDGVVGAEGEHDPYFEPVVTLPEIQVKTNEEEEEEMIKLRCKLFRYHTAETPAEWKERGTGDVKILRHSSKKTVSLLSESYDFWVATCRVLMRQDKTLKIRANHYITPFMELKPNCGSDRAWVWSVPADFADEEPKQELFAIRFANAENARLFKEKFDEARGIVTVATVAAQEAEEIEDQEEDKNSKEKVEKKEEGDTKELDKVTEDVTKEMEKMNVKADQKE